MVEVRLNERGSDKSHTHLVGLKHLHFNLDLLPKGTEETGYRRRRL